ncbi:MAG: amino acid adenylation domain-containing protein, partial [Pseudoxanthomonas sp.]
MLGDDPCRYRSPRTPQEEAVAAIWREVLKVERVGIDDDFFDLGGQSLLATRVAARIHSVLGIEAPLRALFECPTIATLLQRLEAKPASGVPPEPGPVAAGGHPTNVPLSPPQQRLWFLARLAPETPAYHIPLAMRLTGPLDVEALRRMFEEVVRRHGILRTTFATEDGEPKQVVNAPSGWTLPVRDLRGLTPEEQEAASQSLRLVEGQTPFSLEQGPLLRTLLVRFADDEHALMITMHHIVADGWSMDVLLREMAALYPAFCAGRASPLPELSVQYADYAVWQQRRLQGGELERQLAYWKACLSGAATLDLPTDYARPAVQTHNGRARAFSLPPGLTRDLRGLCRSHDVTMFMTLMAGCHALLRRYAGQDDISVGTPIANRGRHEVEDLIGFFVNTLVIRTKTTSHETFEGLLGRVKEACLGAYDHQDVPFERVVEALGVQRDQSKSPLFQVMLTLAAGPDEPLSFGGLKVVPLQDEVRTAKFELSISFQEAGDHIAGSIEYNTALFDDLAIEALSRRFVALLTSIVTDPSQRLDGLALLAEEEGKRLLFEWNPAATDYPRSGGVHQLFEAQVRRTPDAVAVRLGAQTLTYAELNRRADELAGQLSALGVTTDVPVGLCVPRSFEMVVGLIGILKAGGAYVPISPEYPTERIARMVSAVRMNVLLTVHGCRAVTVSAECRVLDLDAIEAPSDARPVTLKSESDEGLAYVIFTSGSTGEPKGVGVSHRAITNHMVWMQRALPLADDQVLQKTSLGFDASVWEVFAPLSAGATMVLAPPGAERDPSAMARVLKDERITIAQFVPSVLALLLEQPTLKDCDTLRRVFCGGEVLELTLCERLRETLPKAEIYNLYGPTECCIDATFERFSGRRPTLGDPIANTRVYVADSTMRLAALGVRGELCIAGDGLARGYVGRPEWTAERFIPDPFGTEAGARMYRTGDVVRRRHDGSLEYLGRADDQVKIRGLRIELGEIEVALRQHPAVQEAVAMVRDDQGVQLLVAYLLPRGDGRPTVNALRSHLT